MNSSIDGWTQCQTYYWCSHILNDHHRIQFGLQVFPFKQDKHWMYLTKRKLFDNLFEVNWIRAKITSFPFSINVNFLFVFCKCNKLSTWELAVLLINSLENVFQDIYDTIHELRSNIWSRNCFILINRD